MNERIKDLLPNPFAVDYQYKDGPLDLYTEKEMFRYAELIVRECTEQISSLSDGEPSDDWERGYESALRSAFLTIQKHFGVK